MKLKELSQTEYLALVWGLLALGTVFSAIRFTVRWTTQRRFHADDWFALASWFSLLTLAVLYTSNCTSVFFLSNYAKIYFSTGIPPPVNPDDLIYHNKVFAIVQLVAMLFFWTTLWAGKFSLLAFYRRLMEGVSGYMRWWWGVVVINILTYWACFLSNFLTCLPLERRWSPDPLTNCSTPDAIASIIDSIKFASGVDIATDFLIMFLPIPLIWGLRIPLLQKFGLGVIFCLGTIVTVFAIFRLKGITDSISVISHTAAQDLAMWSMVECSVAVVVISLPAFRGLLATKVGRTGAGYSGGTKGQLGGSGQKSGNIAGVTAGSQAHSGHIKLHDLSIDKRTRINDNSSSQEELHRTYSADGHATHQGPGINMTREVFVSSSPGEGATATGRGYAF